MTRNTIFRVRSMTKPIVGTAILMLADQGRLSLDDPVANYLPSFRNERSEDITITHLLHHSSGFPDPGYPKDIATYRNLREAVDDLGERGPDREPGSGFLYCDGGSAALGAIVAEVSGMPVEQFIEERILTPLGMEDTLTFLSLDDPRRPRVSSTYELQEGEDGYIKYWDHTEAQKVPFFRASGGVYSTPLDYARFMAKWMDCYHGNDVGFLSREIVATAFAPGVIPQYGMHWNVLRADPDQGRGTDEPRISGFGHIGSDGTIAFAFPEEDLIALYFSQSRGTGTYLEFLSMIRSTLVNSG